MGISDFSTLVQALTGVVALILSILVALQSKKIHELTDIVKELKSHTIELQQQNFLVEKRYQLEKSVTLEQRMPVFQHGGIVSSPNQMSHEIHLFNIGKTAFNLSVLYPTQPVFKLKIDEHRNKIDSFIKIYLFYKSIDEFTLSQFDFYICYSNNYGHTSKQRIVQKEGGYVVFPPEEAVA